ncbi:MAG TPA: type II toxin-antitoxin system ParD family antitoxin [Rhizomicrobium sp.]|jgi:antitoxin ParD1/3/4
MVAKIDLTRELEHFAEDCVASGRYEDVSDVLRSALRLLQEREERRLAFNRMLEEVEAYTDLHGSVDIETVAAEMDKAIAES